MSSKKLGTRLNVPEGSIRTITAHYNKGQLQRKQRGRKTVTVLTQDHYKYLRALIDGNPDATVSYLVDAIKRHFVDK
ncbi:hypothetical protein BDB00DRAFT_980950, partial [Zychaea mexicana]|uniref:uncharacterized protein n=1 Tax=Zychaea mexicana TaxID=64656 RepID=UPI0022FEE046